MKPWDFTQGIYKLRKPNEKGWLYETSTNEARFADFTQKLWSFFGHWYAEWPNSVFSCSKAIKALPMICKPMKLLFLLIQLCGNPTISSHQCVKYKTSKSSCRVCKSHYHYKWTYCISKIILSMILLEDDNFLKAVWRIVRFHLMDFQYAKQVVKICSKSAVFVESLMNLMWTTMCIAHCPVGNNILKLCHIITIQWFMWINLNSHIMEYDCLSRHKWWNWVYNVAQTRRDSLFWSWYIMWFNPFQSEVYEFEYTSLCDVRPMYWFL